MLNLVQDLIPLLPLSFDVMYRDRVTSAAIVLAAVPPNIHVSGVFLSLDRMLVRLIVLLTTHPNNSQQACTRSRIARSSSTARSSSARSWSSPSPTTTVSWMVGKLSPSLVRAAPVTCCARVVAYCEYGTNSQGQGVPRGPEENAPCGMNASRADGSG